MATANSTGLHTDQPMPLAANAMAKLCKFVTITKNNKQAHAVWEEYLKQERPVIDVATDSTGHPVFILSGPLASFLGAEVNHG